MTTHGKRKGQAFAEIGPENKYKHLYTASQKDVEVLEMPSLKFIMIDGIGDPSKSKEYQGSIQALYNMAYTLKFAIRKEEGIDYPVMALEGLWWTDEGGSFDFQDRGTGDGDP